MNQILEKKFASLAKAKYRREHGLFLVEGEHCVEELIKSDWHIARLLISEVKKYEHFKKSAGKNVVQDEHLPLRLVAHPLLAFVEVDVAQAVLLKHSPVPVLDFPLPGVDDHRPVVRTP